MPVRDLVHELRQRSSHLEPTLSPAQVDEVTRVLARHAVNAQQRIDTKALDWDAALAEARGVLTPPQFDQLLAMRRAVDLRRELTAVEQRLKGPLRETPPAESVLRGVGFYN